MLFLIYKINMPENLSELNLIKSVHIITGMEYYDILYENVSFVELFDRNCLKQWNIMKNN